MGEILNLLTTEITQARDILEEVSEQAATAKATAEHAGHHYAFVYLVRGGGPTQHRVGLAQRHELGFEILERFFL